MSARWLLTFEAIDPRNLNGTWNVGIPERLYKRLQQYGHEKAIARLHLVAEVLQGGTIHLYEGWSRPGKEEECFVYVGTPKRDFKSLTIQTPAPQDMLFLVFVLSDGTIDEWTWRQSENLNEGGPSGIAGRCIWSQNPS